ncbi:MAG TPA: cyclic nucleotide-binding domain-containing protein [Acidimicrobiia bacterium]|nr:cyclic nucleotide-binding domain-containing protein [Acidimicrobiia bacterium]
MNLRSLRESSELLTRLSNTELEFFETVAQETRLANGEILFEEGGAAENFFIVVTGKIGLEMTIPGRAPVVIQTLGPGDLLGVSWFFPPYRWNWRARALEDTTLVAFDALEVRHRCEANRDLAFEVQGVVAEEVVRRLHRTRIQLLDVYRTT